MITRCLLWLLLVCAVGCGGKLPPEADSDRARNALQTALETWKGGEKVESLQKRQPAIYFNDELWRAERQLVDFAIGDGSRNGMGWRCEVKLTTKDAMNQSVSHQILYQIDTDPVIVIVQQF